MIIKTIIALLLSCAVALAGQGMGPGPGVKGYSQSITNLITNGDFATDTTGWDVTGGTWTAGAVVLDGAWESVMQAWEPQNGITYNFSISVSGSGIFELRINTYDTVAENFRTLATITTTGTVTGSFTGATNDDAFFGIYLIDFENPITIDNIVVWQP